MSNKKIAFFGDTNKVMLLDIKTNDWTIKTINNNQSSRSIAFVGKLEKDRRIFLRGIVTGIALRGHAARRYRAFVGQNREGRLANHCLCGHGRQSGVDCGNTARLFGIFSLVGR